MSWGIVLFVRVCYFLSISIIAPYSIDFAGDSELDVENEPPILEELGIDIEAVIQRVRVFSLPSLLLHSWIESN